MLNRVTERPTALAGWMVQLQLEFARSGRPPRDDDDVEPMLELLSAAADDETA